MDIFNNNKVLSLQHEVEMLKQDVELYRGRCTQLESEAKNVKDLELKVKCLKMWCDDDEAIDELMAAVKEKEEVKKPDYNPYAASQAAMMAQGCARGSMGGAGVANFGIGQAGAAALAAMTLF